MASIVINGFMFEGTHIELNYEFYGDICWLSVERDEDFEVLEYLAGLLEI